ECEHVLREDRRHRQPHGLGRLHDSGLTSVRNKPFTIGSLVRTTMLAAALAAVAACGDTTTTTTTPTTPTGPTTSIFASRLTPGGAVSRQFAASTNGTVTAMLTNAAGPNTLVGLA